MTHCLQLFIVVNFCFAFGVNLCISMTLQDTDRCCLSVSGNVCWRRLLSVGFLCSLEMSGGCVGDVWGVSGGIRMVFMDIGGDWMCLWGIWVLSP